VMSESSFMNPGISPSTLQLLAEAARRFGESLFQLNEATKGWAQVFDEVITAAWACAWSVGSTPSERYALAGHPYGKSARGKKRWTLLMKRRARA
jgi:hypothetical protein